VAGRGAEDAPHQHGGESGQSRWISTPTERWVALWCDHFYNRLQPRAGLDEKAGAVVLKVGNKGPGFDGKPIKEYEVRVRLKDGKLLANKAGETPSAKKP
jgi:hypothetical protein